MTMRRTFVIFSFLTLAATMAVAAPKKLTFGIAEGKEPGASLREHAAFIKHLNSSPEFVFEVKVFKNYEELYAAFKKKSIDLAALGPVKYVQARYETGAIPFVAEGSMQRSAVFVRPDSPIKSVAQLKGKRFAFGYADSTSTYVMPLLVLSKHHIKPADLGASDFVGAQEKIVEAVLTGRDAAGAIAESVYEANKTKIRLLEFSEPFPGAPVIAQKETSEAMIAKLRSHMIAYKPTPEEKKQRFGRGVTRVTDADYNKIRFLVKVVLKKTYVK